MRSRTKEDAWSAIGNSLVEERNVQLICSALL